MEGVQRARPRAAPKRQERAQRTRRWRGAAAAPAHRGRRPKAAADRDFRSKNKGPLFCGTRNFFAGTGKISRGNREAFAHVNAGGGDGGRRRGLPEILSWKSCLPGLSPPAPADRRQTVFLARMAGRETWRRELAHFPNPHVLVGSPDVRRGSDGRGVDPDRGFAEAAGTRQGGRPGDVPPLPRFRRIECTVTVISPVISPLSIPSAFMFSLTCSGRVAPVMTVLTFGFLRHQARAS